MERERERDREIYRERHRGGGGGGRERERERERERDRLRPPCTYRLVANASGNSSNYTKLAQVIFFTPSSPVAAGSNLDTLVPVSVIISIV